MDLMAEIILRHGAKGALEQRVLIAGRLCEMAGRNFWQLLDQTVAQIEGIDYAGELIVRQFIRTQLVATPIKDSGPYVLRLLGDPATTWANVGGDAQRISTEWETARGLLAAQVEAFALAILQTNGAALTALGTVPE